MARIYPPDHPLRSAQLKAEWTDVHIRRLTRTIRRTAHHPQVALGRKRELEALSNPPPGVTYEGASIYELVLSPGVDQHWGLIVGDILTNLRASLDHIAWALAMKFCADSDVALSPGEERLITYPLRLTPVSQDAIIGGLNRNDVRFFPPNAYATIEQFQPYNRGIRPELKLLGVIRELVDEDKHRVVTPVFQEFNVRFSGDQQGMRTRLNQPRKFWFLVPDSQADNLEPQVAEQIVLNVTFLFPDHFPVADFRLIHKLVRDEVIPAFAGFLE